MNGYSKYFDENNEYVNLLVNDKEMPKNILKYGIKLKVYLKKNLIVNQCIMVFSITKYQKIMNIACVYV